VARRNQSAHSHSIIAYPHPGDKLLDCDEHIILRMQQNDRLGCGRFARRQGGIFGFDLNIHDTVS
jgi:hypothetical protein